MLNFYPPLLIFVNRHNIYVERGEGEKNGARPSMVLVGINIHKVATYILSNTVVMSVSMEVL